MLIIRLQRTGKKNQADFRIVLAEKQAPVQKKFIEVLGSYNPRRKTFVVKKERMDYWISQNIAFSPTVNNLLVSKGFLKKPKIKAFSVPKKETPKEAASTEQLTAATPAPAASAESAPVPAEASQAPTPTDAVPVT